LASANEAHPLPLRLKEFFPGLPRKPGENAPSEQFHWDFSEEELERLDEAGRQSVRFLKEEAEWEASREVYWNENG
jgi:hypothetical protein